MDLNEECQQSIQLQKQNRLLRNQMIGNTQNLDKERASRIELQSSMKKLRVSYILNSAWFLHLFPYSVCAHHVSTTTSQARVSTTIILNFILTYLYYQMLYFTQHQIYNGYIFAGPTRMGGNWGH